MGSRNDAKLPEVDFEDLILGFSSSALAYLGYDLDSAGPAKQSDINLELAKQNIDVISMLETKTKGNLTPEEQELLKEVLSDLKLKFVEATKFLKK